MKRLFAAFVLAVTASTAPAQWSQFGGNPRHTSSSERPAQPLAHVLADVVHDPEVSYELRVGGGSLNVHYAAPLLDGEDVYMSFKTTTAATSQDPSLPGPQLWDWSVHRLHWENGQLADKWTATLDYQPVPSRAGLWEPVLQPVIANGFIYAAAYGGSLQQIDRNSGSIIGRINPFGVLDGFTFVSGPPAADSSGNIFYTAVRMQAGNPWADDIAGAWLIRVSPEGSVAMVPFSALVADAPKADDVCRTQFPRGTTPIPPTPAAVPPSTPCGSQRPGINVAPAIAADGTIYLLSRAHLNDYYAYLVAVNPDLTPKWDRSLRLRFHDGCNVILPPNGTPGGCAAGTTTGVDPNTNEFGSGRVNDLSTASPVVAPDGSIIYGAYSSYNLDQGHLMHFAPEGSYLGDYPFGWDTTPAIWQHDGTYSIVTKENHYALALQPAPGDFVTQLDPHFNVEWQYRNPSRIACHAENDCDEEIDGFEFCVTHRPSTCTETSTRMPRTESFMRSVRGACCSTGFLSGHRRVPPTRRWRSTARDASTRRPEGTCWPSAGPSREGAQQSSGPRCNNSDENPFYRVSSPPSGLS